MVKPRPDQRLVREIAREEATLAGIDPALVFTRDRRSRIAWVRSRVCQRLVAMNRFSLPGIGMAMGLDHTTILHAKRRVLPESPPLLRDKRVEKSEQRPYKPSATRTPRRVVTDADSAIFITLHLEGLSLNAIGAQQGWSPQTVRRALEDAGVTVVQKRLALSVVQA